MKIKFLFINAIDSSKKVETKYPPLGIGYLISSLRTYFGRDEIIFKVICDNVEEEMIDFKPDIVGISSVSQNYNKAITCAKIAKKYKLPVIVGGVHISMMPSSLTSNMDVGVIGEGEVTICGLLESFIKEGRFLRTNLKKIKGVIYWNDDNTIAASAERELIPFLDKLPPPARDLFDIQPRTYMFTSRGCPYHCSFCASSLFWNKVRFFSAEYVVNEIEYLINEYNVKHINFYDDIFSVDVKRIKKIISIFRERGYLGKVDFSCAIRANMVNDEVIRLLKEMGVRSISMGLESGSDKILKYLKRDSIDVRKNENAIRIIKKHGISVSGSFIIGAPEEDKEDILKTLKFISKSKLDGFDVYVLTPFPGTLVWDYAISKGLVNEKMDWGKLNVNFSDNYNSAVILSEKLTRKKIHKLFLQFRYEKRKIGMYKLFKKGVKNPLKIPWFLTKKISAALRNRL
ncbi:MAG: radical SAM protein [bacterium]|nr:radical SAM protein [bacterium]